jgi:hypothetical protein
MCLPGLQGKKRENLQFCLLQIMSGGRSGHELKDLQTQFPVSQNREFIAREQGIRWRGAGMAGAT